MHRHPRRILSVCASLAILLLAAFAVAIATTQQSARHDVERRFHDRATRAAAVTQSLFLAAFSANQAKLARIYGDPHVSQARLETQAKASGNAYAAVLGPRGEVLAATRDAPAAALRHLRTVPPAVRQVLAGRPIGLSDVLTDVVPRTPVIEYATRFDTPSGRRTLVTAANGRLLGVFIGGLLARGPNAEDATTYVLDSNGRVVGAPGVSIPNRLVRQPGLLAALRRRPNGRLSSDGTERYYTSAPVPGTPWRVAMSATTDRLYASVSGAHVWVPWLLFAALAAAALSVLWVVRRLLNADRQIEQAYGELAGSHEALERTNAELTRRAAELARSNAELEQFASIASHDLQEPLRKVQAFGEQLELDWGERLDDEGRENIARMRRAASRMQALVDDLLRFARITTQGAPLKPVSLDDVLAATESDLEVALEEAQGAVLAEPLPAVTGDRGQLEQLFLNLLSNAIKFRRPGVAPVVHVTGRTDGDRVVITVTDNGIGFDNAYSERIFGIFQRLHDRDEYPGTGIGLALCQKIVDRHGGAIQARGRPGEGSTIELTLSPAGTGALVGDGRKSAVVAGVR